MNRVERQTREVKAGRASELSELRRSIWLCSVYSAQEFDEDKRMSAYISRPGDGPAAPVQLVGAP